MLRYQHQTHLDHQTFACISIPTLLKVGSKLTTKHQGMASEHCIISPFNGSISVSACRGKHYYAVYVQSETQICSLVPFQVSKAIHPMGLGLILSIQVRPLILQQAQNRVTQILQRVLAVTTYAHARLSSHLHCPLTLTGFKPYLTSYRAP